MWPTLRLISTLLEIQSPGLAEISMPDLPGIVPQDDEIQIIDETKTFALNPDDLDLGPATDLGPGSLNLDAMAALDSQIQALPIEFDVQGLSAVLLPEPFACDLTDLSEQLTAALSNASDEVIALWEEYANERGVYLMTTETQAEVCASNQALIEALADASDHIRTSCQPITMALMLLNTVSQISPNLQPTYARDLSLLAQKQDDYRTRGLPPTELCPDYKALEAKMQGAIRG